MITATSGKHELFTALDEAVLQMQDLIAALDGDKINSIPYKDSWTAGQLVQHVKKSISGMAKAMAMETKPAGRDVAERIPELQKIFLDFSSKMQSPEFIIPEPGPYQKQSSIDELKNSLQQFKAAAGNTDLDGLAEGLPFGPITKLEMLHFVLYHTQRHLNQLKKISGALGNK